MLQLTGVRKSYGLKTILDIPGLALPKGIYWLQGPNGSGKTTLLRMLAGILPFRGTVRLGGVSLEDDPVAYRRAIGWADAEPLYPDFLTGEDLVAFYSDIIRPPAGQVRDLIDRFGVAAWLGSKTATWSAGMCKKISLLLAFLGRPVLITLDEPLITLDQQGLAVLLGLIKERYEGNGMSDGDGTNEGGGTSDGHGTSFILSSHQAVPNTDLPGVKKMIVIDGDIRLK